jgi:hypothetical protein
MRSWLAPGWPASLTEDKPSLALFHGRPKIPSYTGAEIMVEAGEPQEVYVCPERSRREPAISASFFLRLQRFSWFSRVRAKESESCFSAQTI